MTHTISHSDDVIDSRDVIVRLGELKEERDDLERAIDEAKEELESADGDEERGIVLDAIESAVEALKDWDADNKAELDALQALNDEAEGYADDWKYGATLIRATYFTEYCQELLDDIGDLPKDLPGYIVIDWDATAENLKADYTEVDFDGTAYLVR